MSSGKAFEPLSGSGRLISGEYDNITKPCAVQAILESLMAQDMSDGTHRHTFPLLNIQHSTFHRHSSVPVTADQSTMHTTQGDVKAVQKRTFCRRKKILNICNLSYIPTKWILLSTICCADGPPSLQRGKYVISFYFPLFKQSGINYPPTSSVPLSFKKGASFLMLSFS